MGAGHESDSWLAHQLWDLSNQFSRVPSPLLLPHSFAFVFVFDYGGQADIGYQYHGFFLSKNAPPPPRHEVWQALRLAAICSRDGIFGDGRLFLVV